MTRRQPVDRNGLVIGGVVLAGGKRRLFAAAILRRTSPRRNMARGGNILGAAEHQRCSRKCGDGPTLPRGFVGAADLVPDHLRSRRAGRGGLGDDDDLPGHWARSEALRRPRSRAAAPSCAAVGTAARTRDSGKQGSDACGSTSSSPGPAFGLGRSRRHGAERPGKSALGGA